MTTATWGIVLVIAALLAIALHVRRWRARQVPTMQFAAGMIARAGFLFLGVIYATGFVYGQPRAPLLGLGIVGIGIVLNLAAGVIDNIRRTRAPFDREPGDDGAADE